MGLVPALALVLLAGIVALGCGDEAGGADGTAGTGASHTSKRKTLDCGVHTTTGSCSPSGNHCYCQGWTCENPGPGSYFCVYPCGDDSDCVFDLQQAGEKVPWTGTCGDRGYCVPKS